MSAKRIDMHRLEELVRLHRTGGRSVREVARVLGMSPNTERAYREALRRAGLLEGSTDDLPSLEVIRQAVEAHRPVRQGPQEASSIAAWRPQVEAMLAKGAGAQAIYDALRTEGAQFEGSLWAVKRMVRRIKREAQASPEDVVVPVQTKPGHVAQVDFGFVGKLVDPATGQRRKAWAFVCVLGHSRLMWARIVFDQTIETWQRLHVGAFEYFGGVPEVLVPDNLKAAIVRAAFSPTQQPQLNRSYRELAKHYGFVVDPNPPYSPEKKGKVESGVKYLKRNFVDPRDFTDGDDANARLAVWLDEVANVRTHGTTRREPRSHFEADERGALRALPAQPFEPVRWHPARIHRDSHVVFDRRRYPVPHRFLGKEAWLRATAKAIEVYVDDQRVIVHDRTRPVPDAILALCLPPGRADYRHRDPEWWQARADELHPDVGEYIRRVFESDRELSQLRTVQAMLGLLPKYPVERAAAACRRADFYGNYSYVGLKRILTEGLDLLPLPTLVDPKLGVLSDPTYARNPLEYLNQPLEVTHDPV